jgi:hypothetical protein
MSPVNGAQDETPARSRPAGVQKLLDIGRPRELPAGNGEVAAVWRKTVESATHRSARVSYSDVSLMRVTVPADAPG